MNPPRLQNDAHVATRDQVLARRAAVYAGLVLAAWAALALLCVLALGWSAFVDIVSHPRKDVFWVVFLPGPAAALGAAAVHEPFMRAVLTGRAPYAHGWAVIGMLTMHVVYAALLAAMFVCFSLLGAHAHQADNGDLLDAGMMGLEMGADALLVCFLPNVLIAEIFAGVMVYVYRGQSASRPASEIQSILEGARNEPAAFAE